MKRFGLSTSHRRRTCRIANDAVRLRQRRIAALRFGVYAVDGVYEEVSERVRDCASGEMNEGGEPGQACRFTMSAQLPRRFNSNPLSKRFEAMREGISATA